jgi:hypothetical protein
MRDEFLTSPFASNEIGEHVGHPCRDEHHEQPRQSERGTSVTNHIVSVGHPLHFGIALDSPNEDEVHHRNADVHDAAERERPVEQGAGDVALDEVLRQRDQGIADHGTGQRAKWRVGPCDDDERDDCDGAGPCRRLRTNALIGSVEFI